MGSGAEGSDRPPGQAGAEGQEATSLVARRAEAAGLRFLTTVGSPGLGLVSLCQGALCLVPAYMDGSLRAPLPPQQENVRA